MTKHVVFILHGIGKQAEGYASEIVRKIKDEGISKNVVFVELAYAEMLDQYVKSYTLNENSLKNIDLKELRAVFNETVFDGISYGYKKTKVLAHLNDQVNAHYQDQETRLTFIAHSLGGIVLYDLLSKYNIHAHNIFTLGTPLALRLIGQKPNIRVDFWLNIVGSSDIIGKPLKTDFLNIQECSGDYIVSIGSFIQRKTPLSHTAYWTDDNVIKPIAHKLSLDVSNKFDRKTYFKWLEKLWNI
jgi:predicted esterase